jgi:class 3 adenylate cyclase/predicted ATPase
MLCAGCGFLNRDGVRFCEECGARLDLTCASCGATVPPGRKFCGGCGASLTVLTEKSESVGDGQVAARAGSPAERRQLTVMFCDLVGSTNLSAQLDPEVLRDIVRSYQETCAVVIGRFGGHIAQYLGDGLLVYFGYPVAHEDDAQRAARAALGILGAMEILNARLHREKGVTLALRVGIHTGLVVVGEIGGRGRQEELALGETPNVAARLQAIAEPDTVVISAPTYRLVQEVFTCVDLGDHVFKGLSVAMRAYRVQGERRAVSSLEPSMVGGLTPLVGREQEVGLLLSRWEQVKEGLGQAVLLSGEPGIGKSRLVRTLKEHIAGESHTRWECRCSAYHHDSALYPVVDLFERALQFGREEPPTGKLAKIEAALARYGLAQPEAVALWAALLSVPTREDHPPLNLTPQRQKQKTFEAILSLLLALAAEQPVIFIIEDLHWVDPSTRELLDLVLEQVPTTSILMLLTFRPEFQVPWGNRAHLTQLTLGRFTRRQTGLMVEQVTGGKALPAEVLQQVVTKTDGVPLFVEELTKMVLESGLVREREDRYELGGALPPLAIPSTLQDSLMARLDRLATVKEVAQLGAALGRTFPYSLLQAVASVDETTLQEALARLVQAELLYQRGVPPGATYVFKHALIQETAYHSMLMSRRQQLHQRVADILARQFRETAETQPELVAHHYTEAGLAVEAIDYWRRAGQRAIERSANIEAIAHFTKALEVLERLPDDRKRLELELEIQTALGPALMSTKGLGAVEVERAYARGLALCRQLGDTEHLFEAQRGLWEFHELRGDMKTAHELAKELPALADQDRGLRLVAHDVLGDTLFWLGEFKASLEQLEQGIGLYQPEEHHALVRRHGGYDPGVACRSFSAYALWYLGYPDRALERTQDALSLSRTLAHPFTLTMAVEFAAYLHHYRREAPQCEECADADIAYSVEQANEFFLGHGTVIRGWALAQQGRFEEGVTEIRRGMAVCRGSGAELERPHWLACLAEACLASGQIQAGLDAVTEALAQAQRTAARFNEAELYRLRGELLLRGAIHDAEAEASFRQALAVAQTQQAKSLELRAAMSLSRLLRRQGKRDDARRLLAEVYGWFTEGFATADLRDAAAFLEELTNA